MSADLWQLGCERLATELPEQQFNTWIRPLAASAVVTTAAGAATDGAPATVGTVDAPCTVVTVRVPNRFKLDWIRTQYAARIEALLCDIAGHSVRLELTMVPSVRADLRTDAMALAHPAMALRRGPSVAAATFALNPALNMARSEERRVGKECA